MRLIRLPRVSLAIVALALAAVAAAPAAHAQQAYAYAQQTISNLNIVPNQATSTGTTTQASAAINGSGSTNSAPLDTLQVYLGGAPPSPQNSFVKYSAAGGGSQAANLTRSDALITTPGTSGSNAFSAVAESFLAAAGTLTQSGGGQLSATYSVPSLGPEPLVISYNYANDLLARSTGAATATASYQMSIVLRDQAGNIVFSSLTPNTNLSLASPPSGPEVIRSGTESVTTPGLAIGGNYTLTLTSNVQTSVTTSAASAAPEPGPLALLVLAGLPLAGGRVIRRRAIK